MRNLQQEFLTYKQFPYKGRDGSLLVVLTNNQKDRGNILDTVASGNSGTLNASKHLTPTQAERSFGALYSNNTNIVYNRPRQKNGQIPDQHILDLFKRDMRTVTVYGFLDPTLSRDILDKNLLRLKSYETLLLTKLKPDAITEFTDNVCGYVQIGYKGTDKQLTQRNRLVSLYFPSFAS